MPFHITWLSHAGFQLDIDGYTVLIDPFLTGNPLAAVEYVFRGVARGSLNAVE